MKEIIEILKKRSWKVYAFMFSLFAIFFIFSFLSAKYMLETDPKKIDEFLLQINQSEPIKKFHEMLKEEKFLHISLFIFLHNSQIAIINYFFGATFIFPIIIQISNSFLVGFLVGVSEKIFFNFFDFAAFLIVLLIEVVSITLAGVEGMYITYSFLRPEKMWKTKNRLKSVRKTVNQSMKILILILLMLFIASIIETVSIYYQYKSNIEAFIIGI
ncbi:MAG: stage II sporulation protein M [Candidatus Aenigmatarchaeota archaeon]|nr:stage II sporulation protein M [Candidatus Aenigmarchaeota archaeon]